MGFCDNDFNVRYNLSDFYVYREEHGKYFE